MLRRKPLFRNERPGMAPRVRGEQVTVMSRHNPPTWGLKIPGRPATPSEGAAQQYDRVGPAKSQKLFTFDNGTSLKYGPEDPVDEFDPSKHPFVNQIALIDTVVRECNAARARFETGLDENDDVSQSEFIIQTDLFMNFRQREYFGPTRHIKLDSGFYAQVPSAWASITKMPSVYLTFNKSDFIGDGHPGLDDTRYGVSMSYHDCRDGEPDNYRPPPPPARVTHNAVGRAVSRGDVRGGRGGYRGGHGSDRGGRGGRGRRSFTNHDSDRPPASHNHNHNSNPPIKSNHARGLSRGHLGLAKYHRGRGSDRGRRRCPYHCQGSLQIEVELEDRRPETSSSTVPDQTYNEGGQAGSGQFPRRTSHYIDQSYEALKAENDRLVEEAGHLDSEKYFNNNNNNDACMRASDSLFDRVDAWNDGSNERVLINNFHIHHRLSEQDVDAVGLPSPGFKGIGDHTFNQGYEESSAYGNLSTTAINTMTNNDFQPPPNASGEADMLYARFLDMMNSERGIQTEMRRVEFLHNMDTFKGSSVQSDDVQAATTRRRHQQNTDQGSPIAKYRARPPYNGGSIRDRPLHRNRTNLGQSITRASTPLKADTGPVEPPRSRSANFLHPCGDFVHR